MIQDKIVAIQKLVSALFALQSEQVVDATFDKIWGNTLDNWTAQLWGPEDDFVIPQQVVETADQLIDALKSKVRQAVDQL